MSSPKLPRPKTMMFVSALLCVSLVPLVYAAFHRTAEQQQHFDKIANMTESDRRQLEHNFQTFQNLPPEKQAAYRELHAQLHGESKHLQNALLEYNEFLRSLDPIDRFDIERETKYLGKMRAIRNVISRQNDESQRQLEMLQQSFANTQRRSNWNSDRERSVSGFSPLNSEEIAGLTRILESHQKLTGSQRTLLDTLEGVDRLAQILSIALTASGGSETKSFFNSQIINELIAVLSEDRRKWYQKSIENREEADRKFDEAVQGGKAEAEDRPYYLRKPIEEFHEMVLIGSCLRTFHHELEKAAPTPEEMPAFMKKLPPDEREELLKKHPGDLYDELVKEYYEREGATPLSRATKTIQELAAKRMPKGGPPRGRSGPGRPGSGRPGENRERPGEIPREPPRSDPDGDARGAGFPDRIRSFRNEQREALKPDDSSTQSFD